jgi:hypothetical protein
MEKEKETVVRHKHSFELGGNVTYLLIMLAIIGFLFAMSYFRIWK